MAKKRIESSIYQDFIIDCIAKDMNGPEIKRLLAAKGVSISIPTLNNFIKNVKAQGINVSKLKTKTENIALQVNDKLKDIPELSSIFNRRNFLMETLLDRRKKLIDFSEEGKRTEALFKLTDELKEFINIQDKEKSLENLEIIKNFIKSNFNAGKPIPAIEDLIRQYTMDMHKLCKYIEQWTSKYEIEKLLEILSTKLTKSAVECFGPMLKKEDENSRNNAVQKFIKSVEDAMNDLRTFNLNIGDNEDGKNV